MMIKTMSPVSRFKRLLRASVTCLTLSQIVACGPAQMAALPAARQTLSPTAGIEAVALKADYFNLMLLTKGSDGATNPVTPEHIASLSFNGKPIDVKEILLPGSEASKAKIRDFASGAAWLQTITQGQTRVAFGGNGAYTFIIPKTSGNGKLQIRLENDSRTYDILTVNGLVRGTFILADGQVKGAFNTHDGFTIKPTAVEYAVMLALIIVVCITAQVALSGTTPGLVGGTGGTGANSGTNGNTGNAGNAGNSGMSGGLIDNPGGTGNLLPSADQAANFYNPNQFQINNYANYYLPRGNQVAIFTAADQQQIFDPASFQQSVSASAASDAQEEAARSEVEAGVGTSLSRLLDFVGSWTAESDLLLQLVPGGSLSVDVAASGTDRYRLTAHLAQGSYSGEGQPSQISADGDKIRLEVKDGDRAVTVELRMLSPNRVGVKLVAASGVSELNAFLNQEVSLRRKL